MSIEVYREIKRDVGKAMKWVALGASIVFIVYLLLIAAFLMGIWH